MPTTTDADEFADRWHSYVDDIGRLRTAAPAESDAFDRLPEIQEELHEIIDEIAEHRRDDTNTTE